MVNLQKIMNEGVHISSSGTTGEPKTIFRTPDNLVHCNEAAIDMSKLTRWSRIYTCARLTHAGGLLVHTLPAYTLGCDIKITDFNAFTFLKDSADYTHFFLPPKMCEAIINTKNWKDCDLSGKTVVMGSDPIPWRHISDFVDKGATVIPNWGMSEVGPCAINTTFRNNDDVLNYMDAACQNGMLPLVGDTFYVDHKIVDDQLYIKSPMCVYDGWFATGDLVEKGFKNPMLRYYPIYYYVGRL